MSPVLLLEHLAAARAIDRHQQATASHRRRHARAAGPPAPGPLLRHRLGWLLMSAGLRLVASAPERQRRTVCG